MNILYMPIKTVRQLNLLTDDEIVQGYRDCWNNKLPPLNCSISYFHGFRNALVDKGAMKVTKAMIELAKDYREHMMKNG